MDYERILGELIDYYTISKRKVILYSFCKREGDLIAIERILATAHKSDYVEIMEYSGNVTEILNSINSCEYIYATRFHAMIIGWCLKKKVLPIIYSNKQLNVINDIDVSMDYWNILNGEKLTVENLIKKIENEKPIDIDRIKPKSYNHFKALDSFVANET